MYIKRNVINKIGLFDPEFEMAFEDVDYSLRAWNAGFRVRYVPEAVVTHMESKTRGMVQGPREIRSQQLFWRKWSKFFDARKVATDDGRLRVPTGPGLGVDVLLDVVERYTTAVEVVGVTTTGA